MVDSPARITCKICGELNTFDNESPKGVFSYSPCQGCEFPLLYRNTNPNRHALNRRTFEKYAEAVSLWGAEIQEEKNELITKLKALEEKNKNLQNRLSALLAESSSNKQQKLSSNSIDSQLIASQHINQLEQYIQDIGDRLNALEKGMPVSDARLLNNSQKIGNITRQIQSIEGRLSKVESMPNDTIPNTQRTIEPSLETDLTLSQLVEAPADNSSVFLIPDNNESIKEIVNTYNNSSPEDFVRLTLAKRAGMTRESIEIDRISQDADEAIFETGNGNYWLFASHYPNIAYLVLNRKTLRLNSNTIESLKRCFELRHDFPLWSLNFVDTNTVKLISPAELDIFDKEKSLWKVGKKGILLFP